MLNEWNPVQVFKCLADETRLAILLLANHEAELCVCELTEALQVSQPKVSRHLAQLRSCGLLQDRRQGQWMFYRLSPALPQWIESVLAQTAEANPTLLEVPLQQLARMGGRPVREAACC
ncbi:metalloregulator ArsR/SmtB family transcription factor [Marinobacterium arenosum]|uniref:metalloregulator ArsR/SmtB family transcription factor n=1 Tax=Marinobacterium arenosum TaxID=2862496 RepID=UPI001C984CC1|nr:metalloregulator ArsR/SmtB family transcription factor [Marinobacterium arenosum]MBY4678441.1 metalloregulator ArsR/SmtB family transcription factor [Marinobacterium arenosum]